jgi:hypothetical protein
MLCYIMLCTCDTDLVLQVISDWAEEEGWEGMHDGCCYSGKGISCMVVKFDYEGLGQRWHDP